MICIKEYANWVILHITGRVITAVISMNSSVKACYICAITCHSLSLEILSNWCSSVTWV